MQETVTQDREKYLGGSDIPAVMGISPFVKRFDLLKYKAEIEKPSFQGNEYTEYGNEMEGKIRDYINEGCSYGQYEEDQIIVPHDGIDWRYHSDGYNEKTNTVLEIKTTSQIHDIADEYKVYLVQLLFGMLVHNAPSGMLAVYERPEDMNTDFDEDRLQIFDIYTSDYTLLMQEILASIDMFNEDLSYLKENKDAEECMLPTRAEIMDMSDTEWQIAGVSLKAMFLLEHEKDIMTAIKQLKDRLREKMERNAIYSVKFNNTTVSYVPAKEDTYKEEFDVESFSKDHPRLAKKYLVQKTVKGKASYVAIRHSKGE